MSNQISLKDTYTERRIYFARTIVVGLFVVALLSLLVVRYFSLQITEHDIYVTQSDRNRVQLQPVPPKRGLIYDRNGVLLAENRPSYSLTIVKEHVDDIGETITLLQHLIEIDDDHIKKFQRLLTRRRPHAAVPLKLKLTEEEIAIVSVNRYRLPGVDVDAQLARHYPQGELFTHVLGYVGRISEKEQFEIDEVNYSGTNEIGKIGLEQFYEKELHGEVGSQNVETNARGRVLRVLERSDPEPGQDITLHIDAYVQKVAHEALGDYRGSVVAIDPKTGGIIAMVSTPSFDANMFVGGISSKNYNALLNSPDRPLVNRSLQGQYAPGSTVKPIFGLAGLHYGVVTTESVVRDPGWYLLPGDKSKRRYRDWTWKTRRTGHAKFVAMEQAIAESCDTYFYDLAHQLGIDRMHDFSKPFGFGSKVGIDNTNERSGLLPSREWKRRYKRLPWYPGETINAGIGQGYLLVTPLQLATGIAALANRGVHFSPRLLKSKNGEEIPVPQLPKIEVEDRHWDFIHHAMSEVVHGARGSAKAISRGAQYKMGGKTGTAQVIGIAQDAEYDADKISARHRDNALFVGFAPLENPKIVVAAILENGEKSSRAAQIVRKVFDAYLIDQQMLDDTAADDSVVDKNVADRNDLNSRQSVAMSR
ncbi:MAG: penicillin-binding protein 2 [Oceanicoccus sp.]